MNRTLFALSLVLGAVLVAPAHAAVGDIAAAPPAPLVTTSLGGTSASNVASAQIAAAAKVMAAQVAHGVREQLATQMKIPVGSLTVEIESLRSFPEVSDMTNSQLRVLGLGTTGSNRLDGLFTLNAIIERAGASSLDVQLSGMMKIVGPVLVARRTLNRGERVSEDSLNLVQMPWRVLPTGAGGVGVNDIVGRSSRVVIPAGSPVYPEILEQAAAIRAGEMVEVTVLSGPGVQIRSRGIARQDGRVGDAIRVEQPDTKKMLSAQVVGTKSVEVQL